MTAAALLLSCTMTQAQSPAADAAADRAGSGATAPAATVSADYDARYAATCAACHGADGRSDTDTTPVLSGQHSFYALTQLFLFREGRRANQEMSAVAKAMSNEDMQGFASFIATLPPVPPPRPAPADADKMARGEALAKQYKCSFCHGADFSGGEQVPRIAGQHETYLLSTLREFKNGERQGYTMAMIGAVSEISQEELDTVAYYLARLGAEPAPAAGR
ncbi:MAG: c-type cytochrome [Burkholderiaceae bacterium]